ncbi:GntR family transcriptional regulator [Rhodococcus sp. NPDC057529]|uniref:GntR family transcriptional regulator n=1 Tax=Rhodococcus sp. NPDC057529 TaxID=3346158 RepID=UPI00366C3543
MTGTALTLPLNRGTKRTQLPEEVASYVRELIISGGARPGEFLRIEPIAEAVGVSSTPVREGLLALRSEGFVQLVPRRGFVVAPITQQDIRDIFWAQAQYAGQLATRAAKRMDAEQIERLEVNIETYQLAIADDDQPAIAYLGHSFHREINLAADSHRLALLLGSVVKQLPNSFYATIEGHVEGARGDHVKMLRALKKRDSVKVCNLMQRHILEGADRLIETLEKRGLWTANP